MWESSLTLKLVYLLKISPIVSIRDSYMREEALKKQYKHYDPLAIALKMLEVVIDSMGPYTGITEERLFENIYPLLKRMDALENQQALSQSEHYQVLENILSKLTYQHKKDGIRKDYVDYAQEPPMRKESVFRLVNYKNFDNLNIVLHAEPEAVNFFLQMLDVNLEDRQQAELHILDRQIKRGDFQNALETAIRNLRLTRQYQLKIDGIIKRTKRNLNLEDWRHKVPEELKNAMIHIKECIETQSQQRRVVNNRLEMLEGEELEQRKVLIALKEKLDESMDFLLPLQTTISEARDTFLSEQWIQELLARKTNRVKIEADFLNPLLLIEYKKLTPYMDEIIPFFTSYQVPKNMTFDQLIEAIYKNLDFSIPNPDEDEETLEILTKPLDLVHYPEKLRVEVVNFLLSVLENQIDEYTLDMLIDKAISLQKNFYFINYLKIIIQGRFVNSKFESSFLDCPLEITLREDQLSNLIFRGNNYSIKLEVSN